LTGDMALRFRDMPISLGKVPEPLIAVHANRPPSQLAPARPRQGRRGALQRIIGQHFCYRS
jgi:hypothetical protein